ncbi:MAG TPA: hypothetical protein VGO67_25965 [Verrucomicrobiae bacterium]
MIAPSRPCDHFASRAFVPAGNGEVAPGFRWKVGSGLSAPSVVPLNASLWKRSVPRQPTSQPKPRDNPGNRAQIHDSRMNTGRHEFMLAVNYSI